MRTWRPLLNIHTLPGKKTIWGWAKAMAIQALPCATGAPPRVSFGNPQFSSSIRNLVGEFNVRNGWLAVVAGGPETLRAVQPRQIQSALEDVQGDQAADGGAGHPPAGVTLIDDFAHHPTAIRGNAVGFAGEIPRRRRSGAGVLNPRSHTTPGGNVFQNELASAFERADCVRGGNRWRGWSNTRGPRER